MHTPITWRMCATCLEKKEVFSLQNVCSTVFLIQRMSHWGYNTKKAQSVGDEVKVLTEECKDTFLLHSAGAHPRKQD